jgi:hypothetical protein
MQRKPVPDARAKTTPPPPASPAEVTASPTLRIPDAIAIDAIADAALYASQTAAGAHAQHCDHCGEPIEGEPSGRGLYMWTRGEEQRFEEPALCPRCSVAIGVTALGAWSVEEEEG